MGRVIKPIVVMLFLWLALLVSGCVMHDSACYHACMDRHRNCVTRSQSPAALDQCDAYLAQCRQRCTW